MQWMPPLSFGWLNGWIPLLLLALTDGVLFLVFPRHVVARLFDRSGWTQQQVVYTVIGKLCALGCLVLLILTPLKLGSAVFIVGAVAGFAISGVQSISRTLVSIFAPDGKSAEFYGFFALAGRTSSIIGPGGMGFAATGISVWLLNTLAKAELVV